jgi:hypothetical protein
MIEENLRAVINDKNNEIMKFIQEMTHLKNVSSTANVITPVSLQD